MLWIPIAGGIVGGGVAVAMLYDYVIGRRGKRAVVTGSGPSSSAGTALNNIRDQVNFP